MYVRRNQHEDICVLRIDCGVIDLPNVVIADCNAASDWVRFYSSPSGLKHIDRDEVFAAYWTHPDDRNETLRHGSVMCAEVLVPQQVNVCYIVGVYASSDAAQRKLVALNLPVDIQQNGYMFFIPHY